MPIVKYAPTPGFPSSIKFSTAIGDVCLSSGENDLTKESISALKALSGQGALSPWDTVITFPEEPAPKTGKTGQTPN